MPVSAFGTFRLLCFDDPIVPGEARRAPGRRVSPERHARGIYYTPPALANYLTYTSLQHLVDISDQHLFGIRILDPACGCGAFLIAGLRYLIVRLIGWIESQGSRAETITSVCTGAMLLGAAGLLDGRRATTHWRSLDWMRDSFPSVEVQANVRVVPDGPVITSAGISAGIDMALTVVTRYHGVAVAEATARHMEYPLCQDDGQDA
ncbi:MAG: DJ-1/PfpI family protein [Phycisphaerales bacterium]|nr:MAG: DJ-1/PfpI family protein [Phycisphaerales bacterium]